MRGAGHGYHRVLTGEKSSVTSLWSELRLPLPTVIEALKR